MSGLFQLRPEEEDIPPIAGLSYLPDYVSASEEAALVRAIDAGPWETSWQRRRQPYGAAYGESDEPPRPIPNWGQGLAARMHREGISDRPFDQMLVNEYLPGQGIALHRDYNPFDRVVVSLSLLSACVMDFRHAPSQEKHSLLLAPRSLLILRDEARYDWQHGIARRQKDVWQGVPIRRARRLSVTFRLRKLSA